MPNPTEAPRNILLLSGGSKVSIAKIAKQSAHKRGLELHISDTSELVPSASIADQFTQLPNQQAPDWGPKLQRLCKSAEIGLIIPTRHSELLALSSLLPQLAETGTAVSLSSPDTLHICIQKLDTYKFLKSIDAPTPPSCLRSEFQGQLRFPLFAKPERGSSSIGASVIESAAELGTVPSDWILQEKANGTEYTINLYISRAGKVLCTIPHQRIAVESGEVVQARTQRHPQLIELCSRIAEELPGATGIINIQAFIDDATGQISVIEINPRIGGGYPLCDAAKGHYIEWLCQEHIDRRELSPISNWTDNLLMMRYREALFSL